MHTHKYTDPHAHILIDARTATHTQTLSHTYTNTHARRGISSQTHAHPQIGRREGVGTGKHTRAYAQHGELHGQARQTWRVITGMQPCCVWWRCSVRWRQRCERRCGICGAATPPRRIPHVAGALSFVSASLRPVVLAIPLWVRLGLD